MFSFQLDCFISQLQCLQKTVLFFFLISHQLRPEITARLIFSGVRTEQDLYARLIDSVTKQVGKLSTHPHSRNPAMKVAV